MSKITKKRLNEIILREIEIEQRIQREINEGFFDSISDLSSSAGNATGGFLGGITNLVSGSAGGAIKQFIAKKVLQALGINDGPLVLVLSNTIEQLSMDDIKNVYSGATGSCEFVVDTMYKAIIESIAESVSSNIPRWVSEVPIINSLSSFLNSGGGVSAIAGALTKEIIADQFSDETIDPGKWLRENVYPALTTTVCGAVDEIREQGVSSLIMGNTDINLDQSETENIVADDTESA